MEDAHLKLARLVTSGALDLLCPEIKIREHHGDEIILQGMGSIRSDARGQLWVRVLAPPGILHEMLRPARNNSPGQVEDEHRAVVIMATDEEHRTWYSHPLIIEVQPDFSHGTIRFRQQVHRLMWRSNRPQSDVSTCSVYFPNQERLFYTDPTRTTREVNGEEVALEWSMDHHRRAIGELQVEFRAVGDGWLRVHAKASKPILPTWPGMLSHAIEFAACRRASPALCIREWKESLDIALFSGPFTRERSLMPFPVHPEDDSEQNFWLLVERFAHFCYSEYLGKRFDIPRLLAELEGIRRGASGSFGTACLTLGVGIEAITDVLLTGESVPVPNNDELRSLETHIAAWPGNETLKRRAVGIVGQIRQVRAADRLKAWSERRGVDARLLRRWRELRNSSAHGRTGDADQVRADLYYGASELLYRMVADTIDYKGKLIATSHPTWGVTDPWLIAGMGFREQ